MSTPSTVNAVADAVRLDAAGPDHPGEVSFRVVSGHPTPQEIAALMTVLSAVSAPSGAAQQRTDPGHGSAESAWSDPGWRLVGPSRDHGGWRSSALPR